MLRCEVLTTAQQVRALATPWRALALRSPATSVHLTWEWISAWCDEYASGRELCCLAAWDETGGLCGLAPLVKGDGPPLPRGCLGFISSDTRSWGFYLDFLLDPDRAEETLRALLGHLGERWAKANGLWAVRMDAASPTLSLLPKIAAELGLHLTICPDRRYVRGPLPATGDDFVAAIPSKSQRKHLRRYQRKLEEDGLVSEVRSFARETDVEPLLAALAAHKAGRTDRFEVGNNFADPAFSRCFRDFATRLQAQDWLVGLTMSLNGSVAAARVGAIFRGRLYSFLASFDEKYAAYGPAHLLLLPFVAEGIARGATELDFLPGEQAHKAVYLQGRGNTVTAVLHDARARSAWPVLRMLGTKAARHTAKGLLGSLKGTRSPAATDTDPQPTERP